MPALLHHKVNIHARNKHAWTPLHACARYGHVFGAEFLLAKGASVNAVDDEGYTPLYRAVMFGHQHMTELLVEHGASLDPLTTGT